MKQNFNLVTDKMDQVALFILATTALMLCLIPIGAQADETPFSYIYSSDSLPKNQWEYEQWNTVRAGKAQGDYTSFDLDQEIEHGFTDNFQGSFYLHSSWLYTHNTPNPDDTTENLPNQSSFDINGVSVELKQRILSPYKDPIGLSLYLEPELGVREALTGEDIVERALEFRLILDKHFLDDRLIIGSNIMMEPEWEREDGERSKELKNEYSLGTSYRFSPHWSAGLEFLNRRLFGAQSFSQQEASGFFLGPVLHYGAPKWWASLTILPQIAGNPTFLGNDANGNQVSDSSRTLGEYEKLEVRLKIAIDI